MNFTKLENKISDSDSERDESSKASDDESDYNENGDGDEEIIKVKPSIATNVGEEDEDEDEDAEEEEDEEDVEEEDNDEEGDVEEAEEDEDEDDEEKVKPTKKATKRRGNMKRKFSEEDSEEEEEDENYLQKINDDLKKDIIIKYHPELKSHNYDEIKTFTQVVRNRDGIIIDPFHKTIPFLTKYELARVLGERAMQINSGGKPYIDLEEGVFDGYTIATMELSQKKIPFIMKRPLPNGGCEYWKLNDLEMVF